MLWLLNPRCALRCAGVQCSTLHALAACSVICISAGQALAQGTLPPLSVEATAKKKKAPAAAKKDAASAAQPDGTPPAPALGPVPDAKGDIGYNATRTTSATKTDTPLRNIPQSITVVTDEQIKDQGFQSIGDISRYVPGVIVHQGEGNRDQISIRGQVASTADFFVDGVRDDASIFRDLYNSERVEFLKGPSALIFGRGGAGGIINRVTKQPEFGPAFGEATVEFGSFDHKRTVIDAGSALGGSSAFRILGMYEDSGSFRDFVDLNRWAVNPTFTFKLSDTTKMTVGYEHAFDHRTADRGIPSILLPGFSYSVPAPTDRSTFFGNPDVSFAQSTLDRLYATVEHKFDSGLTVRNHTSWATYDKFYQNVYPGTAFNAPGPGLVGLVAYNNENDRDNLFNQTDFTYKFDLGFTRHTLMFGAEFGHQESDNWRHNGTFGPGNGQCVSFSTANGSPTGQCNVLFTSPTIFSPDVTFAVTQTRNHVSADVQSFYIQDQIQLGRHLELIAGVRHDTFGVGLTNLGPGTPTLPAGAQLSQTDNLLSPRFGVILKPTDHLSLYSSYSVTYLPASGDQFAGVALNTLTLDPEKYTNYEIGAKWDVTRALAFTAAAYRTDRENVRFPITLPDGSPGFVQTGESQVEGLELTLTGYLTDKWQVAGGYNHIFKGELTSATSPTLPAGTPLPLLPEDTFSIWNRYQFSSWFGAGIGLVYHSSSLATLLGPTDPTRVVLPAYTTVDAALFFKLNEKWSAQLNVNNIFNEGYIVSADSVNNLTPGAPTTAILSVTAKF
jgi:catecholate siderophore receptor